MTKFLFSVLFAMCLSAGLAQWDQIGNGAVGANQGDAFGYVLAMDSLGSTYISSSYNNSETGYQAGSARVFSWNGEEWLQKGQEFLGNCPGEHFPSVVDMSADGNVVVMGNPNDDQAGQNAGIVQVFEWDGSQWNQMGSDMFGPSGDCRGSGVSLSANGYRMAIGSRHGDGFSSTTGNVKVFDWNGENWSQVGSTMGGTVFFQAFGNAVSLDASGTTCLVASSAMQVDSELVGGVLVYDLIGEEWVQRGQTIYGDGNETYIGGRVRLSNNGNRWVTSNVINQTTDDFLGLVRAYEWDGESWVQMGSDLVGVSPDDRFGADLDFSGDGTTLVVGARTTDVGAEDTGSIHVFVWNGISWEIIGGVIHGENEDDIAGASVAVNYNGSLVASGEIGYDVPESGVGRVRILGQCPPNQVTLTACDQYELPSGTVALSSGLYEEEVELGEECDDLVVYDLTILESSSDSIHGIACYQFENPGSGEVYSTSGTYYEYYTNSVGCDSIVTLVVDINTTYAEVDFITCDSLVSPSGNYTYFESGNYQDTIQNSMMCDSVITVMFTKAQTINSWSETVCGAYTLPSGGEPIYESGIYLDTLENALGCDSLITIDLTVLNHTLSDSAFSACDEYVSPSGNIYNLSGIYVDTIPNSVFCDSVITTTLDILFSTTSSLDVNSCFSYESPSGDIYTESGLYESVIENMAGCDSTITIDLVVQHVDTELEQDGALLTALALDAEFQWFDCNSSEVINGATASSYNATTNGSYACQITQNGCTEDSDCLEVTSIGIQESGEVKFSCHPNPVHGEMLIQWNGRAHFLSIRDVTGREVKRLRLMRGLNRIDTSQLVAGLYIAQVGEQQVEFIKVN